MVAEKIQATHSQTQQAKPASGNQIIKEGNTREDEQQPVGVPMRPDDKQNQFRAPELKADGSLWGEGMLQWGPYEGGSEPKDLPEGTRPQVPTNPVAREKEADTNPYEAAPAKK